MHRKPCHIYQSSINPMSSGIVSMDNDAKWKKKNVINNSIMTKIIFIIYIYTHAHVPRHLPRVYEPLAGTMHTIRIGQLL